MDWLTARQQRHVQRHRMHTMPTMEVMAERAAHYKQVVPTQCMLCKKAVETVEHGWTCEATEWTVQSKRQGIIQWLEDRVYKGRRGERAVRGAAYDPTSLVIWASGTATGEMATDYLTVSTKESMGTHFLRIVIQASMELWDHRFKQREAAIRAYHGDHMTLKKWIQDLKGQGRQAQEGGAGPPMGSDSDEQGVDDEWEDWPEGEGLNMPVPPQGEGDLRDELD